jgi:hypothetical protein
MLGLAARARSIGRTTMSTLIPRTGIQVRLIQELLRLLIRMPPRIQQRLSKLEATPPKPSTPSTSPIQPRGDALAGPWKN